MIGVSIPTALRIACSAWSCSPSAPLRASTGSSRRRSSAVASGARVTVYGVARSLDGA